MKLFVHFNSVSLVARPLYSQRWHVTWVTGAFVNIAKLPELLRRSNAGQVLMSAFGGKADIPLTSHDVRYDPQETCAALKKKCSFLC